MSLSSFKPSLFLAILLAMLGSLPESGKGQTMSQDQKIREMISLLINDARMERYYHADTKPSRKPLVIALEGVTPERAFEMKKFNMPVEFRTGGASGDNVLALRFQQKADGETMIEFSYAVEGIAGHARFKDVAGKVAMQEMALVER
jgi:hypothetical protein